MLRTIISVLISAVLLVVAFPQIHWSILAWFGLVPWLLLLETKSLRAAFGWSCLVGFLFFAGTLGWFVYVTYAGAIVLIAYLSLYFAVFGLAYRFFKNYPTVWRILILSSVWVALEFTRAHLISGFSWGSLAHSQYNNTFLIQISDITGFYGVSFLIVAVNLLIVFSIKRCQAIAQAQVIIMALLLLTLGYGLWRVYTFPKYITQVTVGVVQPNINQDMKWDTRLQPWIVQKTINLSEPLAKERLDLIVWPETSLPGVFSEVPHLVDVISSSAVQMKTPILMGAITDDHRQYFNSAYLLNDAGQVETRYDKIHLVMFGEYIPWRFMLGWLANIVGLEDFTAGKSYTLMHVGQTHVPFGVLICFEDSLGYLWRNFTNAGAQFMVNMTNDAWFKDTKAPFIHMSASIFASVENKRALVRAANTGASVFIDPFGRILSGVEDVAHKRTFIAGSAWNSIPAVTTKTIYTKYGDFFTYVCFLAILVGLAQRRKYV